MPFTKEGFRYLNTLTQADVPAAISVGGTTKFIPHLHASKWDGECWLDVTLPIIVTTQTETFSDDTINFTVGNSSFKWYVKPDGSLEWEVKLAAKPLVNFITYDLDFPQGLTFHYQPEPTQEELNDPFEKPNVPERVVGSYAVYWNKSNNQYKTGKFCHIYRPQVTDSLGNKIWAILSIDSRLKTLTITIDQTWLNNASYPITLDSTNFGYASIGGSSVSVGTGYTGCLPARQANPSGNLETIYGYYYNASPVDIYMCAYDSDGTNLAPSTRICDGVSQSVSTASWYTFNVADTAIVQNGLTYFARYSAGSYTCYYDTIGTSGDVSDCGMLYATTVYPSTYPSSFSDGGTARVYSVYATASGDAATRPFIGNWMPRQTNATGVTEIRWKKFVCATTGTHSKVKILLRNSGASSYEVHAAIYSHDAGYDYPQARLAYSTSSASIGAGVTQWVEVTLNTSVELTTTTTYYLAYQVNNTAVNARYSGAVGSYRCGEAYSFGAFPDPAPDSGYDSPNSQFDICIFSQADEESGPYSINVADLVSGSEALD